MDTRRILGLALLVLGLMALAYNGFVSPKLGENRSFDIPGWAGVLSIVAGAVLLASSKLKEARV